MKTLHVKSDGGTPFIIDVDEVVMAIVDGANVKLVFKGNSTARVITPIGACSAQSFVDKLIDLKLAA